GSGSPVIPLSEVAHHVAAHSKRAVRVSYAARRADRISAGARRILGDAVDVRDRRSHGWTGWVSRKAFRLDLRARQDSGSPRGQTLARQRLSHLGDSRARADLV